jgi:tape measure domain-containing protein
MANRAIEYVYKLIDQYSNTIKKMSAATKKFQMDADKAKMHAQKFAKGIGDAAKKFAIVGIAGITTGIGFMISQASKMENVVAAFTPLMGGAEKATQLVERLNIEAATTPFQFENIAATAKQLLPVMNGDIEKTANTFRMLGDTAGGNAQKLDSITRGFTKAMLKGKVDMESLNMIAEAGVPIFTEMADMMGYEKDNMAGMFKEISKGTVGTEMLNKVFQKMTSQGGIYFKGMEISSKTLSGVWSTFKDNIAITAASIGTSLLPYIKELVTKGIVIAGNLLKWVQANKDLIKTKIDKYVKELVWTLTTLWKVFYTVFKIVKPFIPVILALAAGIWVAHKAYIVWQVAQWAINAAMTANPIGLIIVGIGALTAAIILLIIYYKQVIAFTTKWWDRLKGLLMILSPINAVLVITIEMIRSVAASWDIIIEKFKGGDILGAILEIGKAILRGIIAPIEALLTLIDKIPFMKGITGKAFEGLDKIKETLGLNIGESKSKELSMKGKDKTQVNVKTDLSVFTENNMKVSPFKKRDNLGYQMSGSNPVRF